MTKYQSTMCKGIAILLMYFHHLFYSVDRIEKYNVSFWPFSQHMGNQLALICKVCVAVFVFITGYGYYKKNVKISNYIQTILKRLLKLMSNYWFIFVLFFVIGLFTAKSYIYSNENIMKTSYNFLMDFLGIAWYTNTPTLNPTWWYMSLALLFIVVSPIMKMINKRFIGMLAIIMLLTVGNIYLKEHKIYDIITYLFILEIGMVCAEYSLFEKFKDFFVGKHYIDIITGVALLVILSYYRYIGYTFLFDASIAILICYLVIRIGGKFESIRRTLHLLGMHSANGFMVHTFLYYVYFTDFYFSLKYFIVIWAALATTTLLVSVIIEKAKKVTHYDMLSKKLINKIWNE